MGESIFLVAYVRMDDRNAPNDMDRVGDPKGGEKMILTKRYFKKFQYWVVGFCILMAALVGSIQTALIILKCGKKR
jgi:hypothetical protein